MYLLPKNIFDLGNHAINGFQAVCLTHFRFWRALVGAK
jgi:hypothetical protein